MSGAVVITGASSGIGAAAALALAGVGTTVYAGVRRAADGDALVAAQPAIRPVLLDVTDDATLAAAVAAVRAGGLPLQGLVNNAGIAVAGPLEYLPVAEVRRQFDVNVFGALAVTQAFLPLLRPARGRIVFVGSISGRLSIPFIGPYSASKFALRALSDAWRNELAPFGLRVALIEPGSVKTPIWRKGRDGRSAFEALLPPRAREHYGPQIDALFAHTEREEHGAMPVDVVTRAIVHALSAPKPKANYVLGGPARAGSIIAMLPAALRDRVLSRTTAAAANDRSP